MEAGAINRLYRDYVWLGGLRRQPKATLTYSPIPWGFHYYGTSAMGFLSGARVPLSTIPVALNLHKYLVGD